MFLSFSASQLFSVNSYHSYSKILLLFHLMCIHSRDVWSTPVCNVLVANQNHIHNSITSCEFTKHGGMKPVSSHTKECMNASTNRNFYFPVSVGKLVPILLQFLEAVKLKSFLSKSSPRMFLKIFSSSFPKIISAQTGSVWSVLLTFL